MDKYIILVAFVLASVAVCVKCQGDMTATCLVQSSTGVATANISGHIFLEQDENSDEVRISIDLMGFTGGVGAKHGFHVHKTNNMSMACSAAEGHFNPTNVNHGAPTDSVRHVGDLGNIVEQAGGVIKVDLKDSIISLKTTSANSIVDRAIVIHAGEDDLGKGGDPGSLTTGNAGARLACCPINLDAADGTTHVMASTLLLVTSLVFGHI